MGLTGLLIARCAYWHAREINRLSRLLFDFFVRDAIFHTFYFCVSMTACHSHFGRPAEWDLSTWAKLFYSDLTCRYRMYSLRSVRGDALRSCFPTLSALQLPS